MINVLRILNTFYKKDILLSVFLIGILLFYALVFISKEFLIILPVSIGIIIMSLYTEVLYLQYWEKRFFGKLNGRFLLKFTLTTLTTFPFFFLLLPKLGWVSFHANPILKITILEVLVAMVEGIAIYAYLFGICKFKKALMVSFMINTISTLFAAVQYEVISYFI